MTEPEKPLPCPFCGSDPCIDRKHDRLGVQVRCFNTQCPAKPDVSHQYEDVAIHSWNTRHTSEIPNLWGNLTFTDPNQENMDYLISQGWKKHPSANVFRKNGRSWLTVKAACVAQQMYDQFHKPEVSSQLVSLPKTAWIVRYRVAKIENSYDVCRVMADSKNDAQHQVLSRKDVHVTWASATPWEELLDGEGQIERDIESLKAMATSPVPERELVMHSLVGGGDIYRDITPPENQLAPLARTILHLLER